MLNIKKVAIATGIFASLSMMAACTTIDATTGAKIHSNTKTGALIGAAIGTAVGYASNKKPEAGRKNALLGLGIGALTGAAIGDYMDKQQAKLNQKLSGSGVTVTRNGDMLKLYMPSDITFPYDSATISPNFYKTLDDVSSVLSEYPSTYIDVTGYADATGSDEYNLGLSQRRAKATADYMVSKNVASQRLYVTGMGEANPIATNATEEGRAKNRRVEIEIRPVT